MKNDTRGLSEHILICLSPSPTNEKIIKTASKMAKAFDGRLTALYVKTAEASEMRESERVRLSENIKAAEAEGAEIITVFGDNIAEQIAEFARLCAVTRVVIGRSGASKRRFFGRPTLTEQLIALAPSLDIYIIPDSRVAAQHYRASKRQTPLSHLRDIALSLLFVLAASLLALLFTELGFTEDNVVPVYILAVLVSAVLTESRIGWVVSAFVGIIVFNFFFTSPPYEFPAYEDGYIVTLVIMLAASLLTGSFAEKIKNHARESARTAYRTNILFDTNRLLAGAKSAEQIVEGTASQLEKLISSELLIYTVSGEELSPVYSTHIKSNAEAPSKEALGLCSSALERVGRGADTLGDLPYLLVPIETSKELFGVLAIYGERQMEPFENSILTSILGECALALKNERSAREKREADIRAENEKLRANLLRAISHDLRTPLTSISGNADNLMSNSAAFTEEMKREIYRDIYDDSMWLVNLVENLLSVTRIDEGRMNINMREELVDEVVAEALRHIGRRSATHIISTDFGEDVLLAKMDSRLVIQLIVNLVDNALKYTDAGSKIEIRTWRQGGLIYVSVADNGGGIPDEIKPRVFEMFYTGKSAVADGRRSLGLGLSLCKSIANAHGTELVLEDNLPSGARFTFTLQEGTSKIYEEPVDTCG